MKSKTKRPGKVIATLPAKKGKWEIYSYHLKGKIQYGNRLIAKNGNLICSNGGFNIKASAIKNVKAVKASA